MGFLNFWKRLFKRKKKTKRREKPARKTSKKKAKPRTVPKGPGARASKPLKEPEEKEIGVITHHYAKISVGIIKLKSTLKVGDKIHIKGAHDDFSQTIKSMQINHKDVSSAKKGDEIGVKVTRPVHENDKVYKL